MSCHGAAQVGNLLLERLRELQAKHDVIGAPEPGQIEIREPAKTPVMQGVIGSHPDVTIFQVELPWFLCLQATCGGRASCWAWRWSPTGRPRRPPRRRPCR